ncbi:MAG: hypothetical protein LBF62_10525 [Tannerellaceae bacterium]|jgi:hypothetical protein|nr:hypothetical protein [Tannerellaceae bacterium]
MKQKDFKQKRSKAVLSKMIGLFLIGAGFCAGAHAQVTIGSDESPAKGALLDVKQQNSLTEGGTTSTKGILFPRVELSALKSLSPLVSSPSQADNLTHKGIVVYNISNNFKEGLYSWDGDEWVYAQNDTQAWGTTGNAGTNPATNYVGTSDDKALSIRTNNQERIQVGTDGTTYLKQARGTDGLSPTETVSQLVRHNATGELLSLVTGHNSKSFNYIRYEIECSPTYGYQDWIADFDTKINTSDFTVVVVGSSFQSQTPDYGLVITSSSSTYPNPRGSFAASTVRAFQNGNTWRLEADYIGATSADSKAGTWTIDCLVINNSVVKTVDITNGNYPGNPAKFKLTSNTGAATAAPAGLYD